MILLNVARPAGQADPVELAGAALAAGLDGVALADSPRLFPDCLVETERVLSATPARLAGPCVLSLGLRHPAAVAGAMRTLDAHHPGRVLAVVGRGESSVRNEGLAPQSLRAYEASLDTLRELMPVSALLLGAASGPRTIAATAARLGGVLVDAGADPAIVDKAVALARSARADVAVWMFVRAVVTDDESHGNAASRRPCSASRPASRGLASSPIGPAAPKGRSVPSTSRNSSGRSVTARRRSHARQGDVPAVGSIEPSSRSWPRGAQLLGGTDRP